MGTQSKRQTMLAEVTADGGDGGAGRLFVRCERVEEAAGGRKSQRVTRGLRVELVEGRHAFLARVAATDRPKALDCSADEFLAAVEGAFAAAGDDGEGEKQRFRLRWERERRTLTLMEHTAGLAMKFAQVEFEKVDGEERGAEYWGELLHSIVVENAKDVKELACRESRIRELEALLRDKDALLDKAIEAKQHAENEVFEGFCAVLNAKKDEIQRLQHELNVASARASEEQRVTAPKSKARKKKAAAVAGTKRPRATRGAKLKAKDDESEESDQVSSSNESDGNDDSGAVSEDDGGESKRKRTKREAVNAYSQLPSGLRPATQRICSSDDVLSDLDAIMKREVEANEAEQERKPPPSVVEPATKPSNAATKSRGRAGNARSTPIKSEAKPPPIPKATAKRAPPPRPIVDSDDEDILDILG